jgi:hypothetical protein
MGIEPTSEAWEAWQNTQKRSIWRLFDVFWFSQMDSNWSSGSGSLNRFSFTVKVGVFTIESRIDGNPVGGVAKLIRKLAAY